MSPPVSITHTDSGGPAPPLGIIPSSSQSHSSPIHMYSLEDSDSDGDINGDRLHDSGSPAPSVHVDYDSDSDPGCSGSLPMQ